MMKENDLKIRDATQDLIMVIDGERRSLVNAK